jgi:hypothetical protein
MVLQTVRREGGLPVTAPSALPREYPGSTTREYYPGSAPEQWDLRRVSTSRPPSATSSPCKGHTYMCMHICLCANVYPCSYGSPCIVGCSGFPTDKVPPWVPLVSSPRARREPPPPLGVPVGNKGGMGTHGHRRRGPKANYEEGSKGTLRVLTRPFPRLGADHGLTAPHVGNARGLEAYLSGTRGALAVGSAAGTGPWPHPAR